MCAGIAPLAGRELWVISSPAAPMMRATAMSTPTVRAVRDWICQVGETSSDSKLGNSLGWIHVRAPVGGCTARER